MQRFNKFFEYFRAKKSLCYHNRGQSLITTYRINMAQQIFGDYLCRQLNNMYIRSEDKKNSNIHGIQSAKKRTRAGVFSVVWIFSKNTVSHRTTATVSTCHRSM